MAARRHPRKAVPRRAEVLLASCPHPSEMLRDEEIQEELVCAICLSLLHDACSLPACAHNFCLKCLERAEDAAAKAREEARDSDDEPDDETNGHFACPVCKTVSWKPDTDKWPPNTALRNVCASIRKRTSAECSVHPGHVPEYYCKACDVAVCDRCALVGDHKGHDIVLIEVCSESARADLRSVGVRAREHADIASREYNRAIATYRGLASRVDTAAANAMRRVERLRREAKSALEKQRISEVTALIGTKRTASAVAADASTLESKLPRLDGQLGLVRRASASLGSLVPARAFDSVRAAKALEKVGPFQDLLKLADDAGEFQCFVHDVAGGKRHLAVIAKAEWTGEDVVDELAPRLKVPAKLLFVSVGGKPLADRTLGEAGVGKGSTIEVFTRARFVLRTELHEKLAECLAKPCVVFVHAVTPAFCFEAQPEYIEIKGALRGLSASHHVHMCTDSLAELVMERSGGARLPQVFVGGKCIGGYLPSAMREGGRGVLARLRDGTLKIMLARAGALRDRSEIP